MCQWLLLRWFPDSPLGWLVESIKKHETIDSESNGWFYRSKNCTLCDEAYILTC